MFIEVTGLDELVENFSQLENRFHRMVQTMKDVAYLIQANTNQRVPLDTGRLEESFSVEVIEDTSEFIEVHAIYDAIDPDDGFHYAEYQHEEVETWQHPIRGEQFYLYNGVLASESMAYSMIKSDYLSLFGV